MMPRPGRLRVPLASSPLALVLPLSAALAASPGCDKSGGETKGPSAAAPVDATDASFDEVIGCLRAQDRDCLLGKSAPELHGDLEEKAFTQLSGAVRWLGGLKGRETLEREQLRGGERRKYLVRFENGDVEVDFRRENLMVLGFEFGGPGWAAAVKGAEFDYWNRFEVYEWTWLLEDGSDNPTGEKHTDVAQIHYAAVVGGLGSLNDLHNVTVSAMLYDSSGKQLYVEPVVYDVAFPSEGLPRGRIVGHIDVPRAGDLKLKLEVRDNVNLQTMDHEVEAHVEWTKGKPKKKKGT